MVAVKSFLTDNRSCVSLDQTKPLFIDGGDAYKETLIWYGAEETAARSRQDEVSHSLYAMRGLAEPAIGRAVPLAFLLGFLNALNDAIGKALTISVDEEGFAEVIATPAERFRVIYYPVHELGEGTSSLVNLRTEVAGSGNQLGSHQTVVAAAAFFSETMQSCKPNVDLSKLGYELRYSTSISRRLVSLQSSALFLATMRALAQLYGFSLADIIATVCSWPFRLWGDGALFYRTKCWSARVLWAVAGRFLARFFVAMGFAESPGAK